MATLTDEVRELVGKKVFAHVATLMPDGRRSPAPCHRSGQPLRRSIGTRQTVTEITPAEADAHVDDLSKKYLGQDTFPYRQPGQERLIVHVRPESVSSIP